MHALTLKHCFCLAAQVEREEQAARDAAKMASSVVTAPAVSGGDDVSTRCCPYVEFAMRSEIKGLMTDCSLLGAGCCH